MLNYGSWFYILSLVVLLALGAAGWLGLRRCSQKVQKWVILVLMLLNVAQHLFKPWVYPQYWGQGFTHISTAYNMCATLILLSPIALVWKNRLLKNFVFVVGTVAGIAAVAVPVWYIGKNVTELGWDYARFYICHALLFMTSVLPLALGLHRPAYREFWQVGLGFLLALCLIVLNDFVMMAMGLYPGADIRDFYGSMEKINPCGLMGPPEGLPWVEKLVKPLSPPVFTGKNPAGQYVPILWYAGPLYVGISAASFGVFAAFDRRNLAEDLRKRRNL